MGNLNNILLHLQENEREYEKMGIDSRDRDINQGWIECTKFFFSNFDIQEKIIIENSPVGIGFTQKDNKQKGE